MSITKFVPVLLFISVFSVIHLAAHAAETHIPSAASAERQVQIGGKTIDYQAHWLPLALKDDADNINASISATSYIKQGEAEHARPVIFLFNGGPGASSSPTHNALGPHIADSFETHLLSQADLVFIDPVGTGFSRNLSDETPYWSREGDAAAALAYIQHWLDYFDREQAEFYVGGASYGSFRLATMLPELTEMGIAGGIFVSPAIDFSGNAPTSSNNRPFAERVPTMAVAAWYHGVAHQELDSAEAVFAKAREFAEVDYMQALYRGTRLSEAEAEPVITRLAELTNMPEELIREHNLRIPTQAFLENLLDDALLGRLDTRVTQPKSQPAANEDRPDAANDPSLGLGRSNKLPSEELRDYLVDELSVDTDLEYYALNLDLNFAWEWRAAENTPIFVVNPLDNVETAMSENPDFKVFVIGGYFDLTTPVASVEYTFTRPGIDPDRVFFNFIPGPHAPFSSEEHREELVRKLHQFMGK